MQARLGQRRLVRVSSIVVMGRTRRRCPSWTYPTERPFLSTFPAWPLPRKSRIPQDLSAMVRFISFSIRVRCAAYPSSVRSKAHWRQRRGTATFSLWSGLMATPGSLERSTSPGSSRSLVRRACHWLLGPMPERFARCDPTDPSIGVDTAATVAPMTQTSRPSGQPQVSAPLGISPAGALVFIAILSLAILLGWRDRGPASG